VNKVHFIFGVHNHQPIGNFDFVFEKAYQQSYLPFLEAMERHPAVRWNLHATGILWEWLESHHADYVERVAEQVRQGRLEILTGGYYEPILAALPEADQAGQIQKLTRALRQRLKTRARGMWLAERVWEPHLAKVLHENGVEYTLVDDAHFLAAGLSPEELCGSYLTEEQGHPLRLLPIRQDLRYAIPFKDPGETLNLLRRFETPSGHRALVMFDDGEKFGLWPDTYEHVYRDGWLEKFLTVLESNGDWITTARISDYLAQTAPLGRVYLPTASYDEMSRWTLPAEAQKALSQAQQALSAAEPEGAGAARRFLRGGFWRNFLTKYEESNNLHKKMLHVAAKVHRAAELPGDAALKPAKTQKMLDALWAGQCNCAYWHGVFGGLYLPHLRQALYRELLNAESLASQALGEKGIRVCEEDFDKDGRDEILIEAPAQNIYIAPHAGGSLFEWDLKKEGVNLLNVLTRRQEAYHQQLEERASMTPSPPAMGGVRTIHDAVRVKEAALEKRLFVDWYRRASLLDHFFHPNTRLDDFFRCQYGEQGDFIKTDYQADIVKGQHPQVRLSRTGTVWTAEQKNAISIEKTLSLVGEKGWQVIYRIQNAHGPACEVWFGCEMAFAFSSTEAPDPAEHSQQRQWARRDPAFGLALKVQFDLPTDLWEFPLQTVSLSEEGFERTYQGTVLVAHVPVALSAGQALVRSWRVEAAG